MATETSDQCQNLLCEDSKALCLSPSVEMLPLKDAQNQNICKSEIREKLSCQNCDMTESETAVCSDIKPTNLVNEEKVKDINMKDAIDEKNIESENVNSVKISSVKMEDSGLEIKSLDKGNVSGAVRLEDDNETHLEMKQDKSDDGCSAKVTVKRRRKRGQIYNKSDDPETIKEKRKRRAVDLKLKNLKWTLNEEAEVIGKRQKKKPQRFELCPAKKRKSCVDNCQGSGDQLGCIPWVVQQLRDASLYTLRLLHRVIYRKQGMFSDKHIRKSVSTFSGFPFDATSSELSKRRDQLEKANVNALNGLCHLLGVKNGSKEDMIDRVLGFLMRPSLEAVDEFLKEIAHEKLLHQQKVLMMKKMCSPQEKQRFEPFNEKGLMMPVNEQARMPYPANIDINENWKQPSYFVEGTGIKLKYIRAVISNISVAPENIVELLHRLFYLRIDEKSAMRRNILEFCGFRCSLGSNDYVDRARILSLMPMVQIKVICRVLCLPTWHRSRQLLTEGIMDFLQVPRISAMKKRVPPHFSDEISFSFDGAQKLQIPELKSAEAEEIEIVPDIIIPDDSTSILGYEYGMENEYLGVKLKNFSNIHFQVISTPAAKLNDVHMVLYLKPSAPNNVRKNVLEFSGYPFDENSPEFQCRRALMEQMSVEDLKGVATVLCVSQYIVDESKNCLIDAIMKFLLKPSALLNSSTMMPTISPAPYDEKNSLFVVKKKATSTSKHTIPKDITVIPQIEKKLKSAKENDSFPSSTASVSCSSVVCPINSLPKSLHIKSLPPDIIIKEVYSIDKMICNDTDEPLSNVKKAVSISPRVPYLGSDEDDDQPLSKMVGHPNDDQLRLLIAKIMKESKLEDITMKHVVQRVFETYPNFDLSYRKEFIKSIVRQILSQMDDQSCSVSTTVITI